MILRKIRFVATQLLLVLSSLYLAACIAITIGRLAPNLRVPTFVVVLLCLLLMDLGVILHDFHASRESLTQLGIASLPPVIIASALVVFVARTIAHFESAPVLGPMFGFFGVIFWVWLYFVVIVGTYQKRRLEEDLANKPAQSSNQALQPTAGGEETTKVGLESKRELRKPGPASGG
jgi:hypothetical protein